MKRLTNFNGIEYLNPNENKVKEGIKKHNTVKKILLKVAINESINLQLKDLFTSLVQYEFILAILRDEKLIAQNTTVWVDNSSGSKRIMIVLLRVLRSQGYYKSKQNITNRQIQLICLNTFNIFVSRSYIDHSTINTVNIKYIPTAINLKINKNSK